MIVIKKGLVLEGGAMRGMFTAGVLDVMMENNVDVDGIIGVSAGAAFGCNFKSKQIGRTIRYNMQFCKDKRYCGLSSLIKTGNYYNKEFCYHIVPEVYDVFDSDTFFENPVEFYLVCTDVEKAEPVYKKIEKGNEKFFEWVRASASLPLLSEIVEVDGLKMLDGGVCDSIPLKYFENIGYEKNIVILTQPKGYKKEKNNLMWLIKRTLKKYPGFVKALENRHIMYNNTLEYIDEQEKKGKVLVIRPDGVLPLKRAEKNPEKLKIVYELGRKAGEENIDKIKEFLK